MNRFPNYQSNKNLGNHKPVKPMVMVVDDEESVLAMTGLVLEEEGYQVEQCSTGEEAIDKINNDFHAVVLDINMPGLTGLQAFERIKSKNPYVPIVLHTGTVARQEDRRDLRRQFRPHAYVIKGSDPEQLLDTVASAVESYGNILENVKFNEELCRRNEEIDELNKDLEKKVNNQVDEIQRINKLKRYLSPQIVDTVISKENDICLGNSRKLLTIFFSDIRGFTTMTENLEPEDTVNLLNEYFSEMTKLVFKHGGTIDKFMGDGLLAFYGDPLECKDHAEKAVRTAIEMKDAVKLLQSRWKCLNCELHMSIGICTGYVTVGNIGSKERMEYTVIGNHVNLAQRLQSKAETDQILVNQRTFSLVKDVFETEIIPDITLKGINKSVIAYKVLGIR